MVYYIKAMADSLTKKVALPLAFAASALTPVMADTTLKIQGPEGDKIAFDETKTVELKITSDDNVSYVDVNIDFPAGLEYVEGSFEKSDLVTIQGHQFRINRTPTGIHLALYSDNLVSIVPDGGSLTDETLGTFKVKASTKLVPGSQIDLTIVDLTDTHADQLPYANSGANDNSIASDPIAIDTEKLAGEWKVYTTALNLVDNKLPFNPLFDEQIVNVELTTEDVNKIGQIAFTIELPDGLTIVDGSKVENGARLDGKNVTIQAIAGTNDYRVHLAGSNHDSYIQGTEGNIFSFKVKAESGANMPTWETEELTLKGIQVTDIYGTEVYQSDYSLTLTNPNQVAKNAIDVLLSAVEDKLLNDPDANRVYDYSKIIAARKTAEDKLAAYYNAGTLGVGANEDEVKGLVGEFDDTVDTAAEANKNLYDAAIVGDESTLAGLKDALEAATKKDNGGVSQSRNKAAAPAADEYRVNNDNNDELSTKYGQANAAINAYEGVVQRLYDQKDGDIEGGAADKYDGALLTDSEATDSKVAEAKDKAEEAINKYKEAIVELNRQNDANEAAYKQDADDLKAEFDDTVKANEVTDETKLPELIVDDLADEKQAAYDAIEAIKTAAEDEANDGKLVDANKPFITLDDAVQAAKDAIQAYKDEAARLVKENDDNFEAANTVVEGATGVSLADQLQAAQDYVAALPNDDTETETGAYANYENFPEIKQAIDDAQNAIEDLKAKINDAHDKGALAFEDGVDAIEEAIEAVEARIENVKTVADQAKAANDAAYNTLKNDVEDKKDAVDTINTNVSDETAASAAYTEAKQAADDAIAAYEQALEDANKAGITAKEQAKADSELSEAKEAAEDAISYLKTVADNLDDLNGLIDDVKSDLQDAKEELERILEYYEFMEEGEKTADLISDIKDQIENIETALNDLEKAIDQDASAEDLLDQTKVDNWTDALNDLRDQLNGTATADGVDQAIVDAEDTYIKYHKQGDANMDGRINSADYMTIVNMVLEKVATPDEGSERFSQADVRKDGAVDVLDAVGVVNLYFGRNADGTAAARSMEQDVLFAESSLVNGHQRIALKLNNAANYAGAQIEFSLPEGMKLVGAELGSRAAGMTLGSLERTDGTCRLLISSMEGTLFSGNEGAVVYIDVEGEGEIEFTRALFADEFANGREFTVAAAAETTGIAGVKAAAEGEQVYSLSGRVMNALKKGVNIIRRADGTTQKVIKK